MKSVRQAAVFDERADEGRQGAEAGGLGGVIVQLIAGTLTDTYKATPQTAYLIMFMICAGSYLIAWTGMKILVPRHKPITDL